MNPKLSIILSLKDREKFTERAILSASQAGHVIVADGSAQPQEKSWTDRAHIDYFYSGHDATFAHWWFKLVLAMDRVRTPYAMLMDNDDVVNPKGINQCIDFLDSHPDYIACSGRIRGFWLWPDEVSGPHFTRTRQYSVYDVPADYGGNDPNLRVLSGFQNSWSFFAVYPTETLKLIRREVNDMAFTDLQLHEKYCAMRALTLGKIKCDPHYTSYLRQIGTSQTASTRTDWVHHFIRSRFSYERDAILKVMGHCGVDKYALLDLWEQWYKVYFQRNFGPWAQFRRAAKNHFPRMAWVAQNRHRYLPLRWSYR